jgi:hypothetical protein
LKIFQGKLRKLGNSTKETTFVVYDNRDGRGVGKLILRHSLIPKNKAYGSVGDITNPQPEQWPERFELRIEQ